MFSLWERWGASLGLLAVVLWVIAFVVSDGSPDSTDSNAVIQAWYESSSHQNTQLIGFFLFVIGVLCVIGFFGALRERLADAEDTPARISQLAFGAGLLSAALSVLAVIFFTVPAFTASDSSAADVAPATFRMLTNAGYMTWVVSAMIGAITVWASSAISLRRGVFPRWFGWVSVLVGVVQLFAVFFFPILLFWLWIAAASALLTWRRPASAEGAVGPQTTVRAP
jgi:hypothetical protein